VYNMYTHYDLLPTTYIQCLLIPYVNTGSHSSTFLSFFVISCFIVCMLFVCLWFIIISLCFFDTLVYWSPGFARSCCLCVVCACVFVVGDCCCCSSSCSCSASVSFLLLSVLFLLCCLCDACFARVPIPYGCVTLLAVAW